MAGICGGFIWSLREALKVLEGPVGKDIYKLRVADPTDELRFLKELLLDLGQEVSFARRILKRILLEGKQAEELIRDGGRLPFGEDDGKLALVEIVVLDHTN